MNILSGFIIVQGIAFLMFSAFVCIFLGLLLGRIKIKGISLGSSGVFIIALLYGAIFSSHIKSTISQKSKNGKITDISSNSLKIIENLGLILFIGSVGFISGPNFFSNLKKNCRSYLIVGLLVILISTLICVVIFYIAKSSSKDIDEFSAMMVGIFAGALTSTPAFSAAKATAEGEYESAVTVGYGLAYIFGVLGVVIFVQIVPKISDVDMDIERELITEKEYKITKRVGTDRTEHTERTKISRSISGEMGKAQKLNIMKSKKSDTLEVIEKEIKGDTKKKQEFMSLSTKTIEKEINKDKISVNKNDNKKDTNYENDYGINSNRKLKITDFDKMKGNGEEEKEKDNVEEEKENEDNAHEEKEEEENNDNKEEKEDNEEKLFTLDKYGFCVFGFGALVGIFIGAIRIPLSKEGFDGSAFSLTTTGGVLLSGLILGYIGKIKKLSLKIDKKVLENLRELGLILFLLGSGISGGTKFIEYFKAIYFVYGILITMIPLILIFFFNKYILKLFLLNNLGSLTGAMTSTPALGTLINVAKTDQVGNSYAATYPIALICVVLSAQFMVLLMK